MTNTTTTTMRILPPIAIGRRSWRLVERNALAYRRMWGLFATGFVEPILYLLSIGIGVGKLVGDLHVGSQVVSYREFVAPGLLAAAAMNGSVLDTTLAGMLRTAVQTTKPLKMSDGESGVATTPS